MTESVIRANIQAQARDDFARGVGRDEHGFEPYELACIAVWQAAWDECNGRLRHLVDQETPP